MLELSDMAAKTHEPLIIARYMTPETQRYLAQRASKASGVSLNSRTFRILNNRQANATLVKRQQYEKALRRPNGALIDLPTLESKGILEESLKQDPTGSKVLFGQTRATQVRTVNGMKVVTYPVTVPELENEHDRITGVIDSLNDTSIARWGLLNASVVVAMFDEKDDRAAQFETGFEEARPDAVVLTPVQVLTLGETPNISF